jgi:hypothetical protein
MGLEGMKTWWQPWAPHILGGNLLDRSWAAQKDEQVTPVLEDGMTFPQ